MKTIALLCAGLCAAASLSVAMPAAAQRTVVTHHEGSRTTTTVYRNDRHGWNHRKRTVCKTVWRHGHRERRCRTVRG